jgi:hypothetical protein
MKRTKWTPSNVNNSKHLGYHEIQDSDGEWHSWDILETPTRIVFGSPTNAVFLEDGYIIRERGESLEDTLMELVDELEVYIRDGYQYTTRIILNPRWLIK